MPKHVSETRTESVALDLLTIRGWKTEKPPRGQLLRRNEYKEYSHLASIFAGRSKSQGGGDAYPDLLLVDDATLAPLMVIETKADETEIALAIKEASDFNGKACVDAGHNVIAVGIAGGDKSNIKIEVCKFIGSKWTPVTYNKSPISWIPSPDDIRKLAADPKLSDLSPTVPDYAILADKADEINRILRECGIKDEFRPAYTGAIMLALWKTSGKIRQEPEYILSDINQACQVAFKDAGKPELANSLHVDEQNTKLAQQAWRISYILRALNIATLTAEHDYLGQLYEAFFRYTGGNTIGQYFTPRHLTRFMADLCRVSSQDLVIDPACGTSGFLIASLQRVYETEKLSYLQVVKIVRDRLIGYESEPVTAALAVANMILRGDGTTGIRKGDCFTAKDYPTGKCTIALMNPPFPHAKTDVPSEKFVERALDALQMRGQLAVILPASLLTKRPQSKWRAKIMRNNTITAVLTLPSEMFQPYASSTTAIVILEKGIAHAANTKTFFGRIEYDGLTLKKSVRVLRPDGKNEMPLALENFHDKISEPGFSGTGIIEGSDWSPGAYIPSGTLPTENLKQGIDEILRHLASFYVRFAPFILRQRIAIESLAVTPTPIANFAAKRKIKSQPNGFSPNTIGSMFSIYYGQKELHSKEHLTPGDVLVISSSGADNGCYGFFDFNNPLAPKFVTVPSTGSIGEAFVQTEPCGVTDDCLILTPKEGTPEEALFIAAAVLRSEKWRFNYGRKITPERIANFKVPSTPEVVQFVLQEWNKWEQIYEQALSQYKS